MMKQAILPRVIAAAAAAIIALTLLDQVAAMGQSPDDGAAIAVAGLRLSSPGAEGGTPEERTPMHSSHRRITGGRT
jgi:hypothetical protein